MKILAVTPDFQHPAVPGSHRHYHFVRELAKRHEITLFTLASKKVPDAVMQEMSGYTTGIHVFDISGGPQSSALAKARYRKQVIHRMRREFRNAVAHGSFDVVLFHGKILHSLIDGIDLPVVIDFCDATSARFRSQMRFESLASRPRRYVQFLRARRYERKLLASSEQIAFISARDRASTAGAPPTSAVIPNGVDLDFWNPVGDRREPNTLALTGVMNYRPNEDAGLALIRNIMPRIRPRVSGPRLLLIGRAPTAALLREAATADDVTVTGEVDDVRPWMERAEIFVAPIQFASGMQNKVLEAMAMRLPVVTTSIVAEGVEIDGPGSAPVVVADRDEDFADAVVALLGDPVERQRLGQAGLDYVRRHFSWLTSAARFEALCFEAAGQCDRCPR